MTTSTDLRQVALAVLDRLRDPDRVAEVAGDPRNTLPLQQMSTWNPVSLAHGHPGVALAAALAARHDQSWLTYAHGHITAAMRAMPGMISTGLHCGPASVLAAVVGCRRAGAGYPALHDKLVRWVAEDLLTRVRRETERRAEGPGVPWQSYDIVSGIGGLVRLLVVCLVDGGMPEETANIVRTAVHAGTGHLAAVLRPVTVDGYEVPGWWVPSHLQPVPEDEAAYPRGDFNAGLAHGVAGPLAVLTAADRHGFAAAGTADSVRYGARWLADKALRDSAGPYWPCRVSFGEETGLARGPVITRSAWCYGAAGVSVALHAAGEHWQRPDWCALAESGITSVFERPRQDWALEGPTVCHGTAGLLAAVNLVGVAGRDADLLAAELAEDFDDTAPFGHRHAVRGTDGLDVAGLLEGSAGIACVLLGHGEAPTLFDELVFAR